MIEITNLNYEVAGNKILDNINLKVEDGEYLAIVGPNGAGKTTLIKCIIGQNKVVHNQVKIDNKCLSCYKKFTNIGYVSQHSKTQNQLPITVNEILSLMTRDKAKKQKVIETMLITDLIKENYNDLSGGQKQKVNIAKSLLRDIKILILDEPEAGLDQDSRKEFRKIIKELNNKGITIIVVSHHLQEIKEDLTSIYDLQKKEYKRIKNV